MSDQPLYTLQLALQTWPRRRRADDTTSCSDRVPTDQDKLVHAQHLFLRHQRATQSLSTRPYAPLMLLATQPDAPA